MKTLTSYYPRIAQALYREPWYILPSALNTLRTGFEAHLQGKLPMLPEDPEDHDEEEVDLTDLLTAVTESASPVAVIPIDGVLGKRLGLLEQCMGGVDVDTIKQQLQDAMDEPTIEAIVLDIHSPGGTVTGIPELADFIAKCNEKKKIYAYVDMLAASAAYYLASQCEAIYTTPSAELGSVGVYMLAIDESRALEDAGIKVNAITNAEATMKLAGASFKPLTDAEREYFQKGVQKAYDKFKAAVLAKRSIDPQYLNGMVFDGEDAVQLGFADGLVEDLDEVVSLITP